MDDHKLSMEGLLETVRRFQAEREEMVRDRNSLLGDLFGAEKVAQISDAGLDLGALLAERTVSDLLPPGTVLVSTEPRPCLIVSPDVHRRMGAGSGEG
jgi:hypothetical protein